MSTLENAIQFIRQGRKTEAQQILQAIIKNDPKNIQAWFWYVETCSTTEQRIKALETCLKMNPENQQVAGALQKFQNQVSATPQKPVVESPSPLSQPQSQTQPSYYSYDYEDKPQNNLYEEENTYSSYSSYTNEPEQVKSSVPQKKLWEMDESEYVDNSMLAKNKKPARSYSTLDVWATVLTVQDVKVYEDLLNDPKASLGRAFTWMAIAGLVNALLLPLVFILNPGISELASMPEFQGANTTSFLFIFVLILLIVAPISSVINLAIVGGIQNFLARFFAGAGNYTRTVYALAAFLSPITILSSLVILIPIVGQCLSFPLAIYNIVLNVRALKAAHFISTGAAIGVIFSPAILVFVFGCLLVLLTSGGSLLQ